MNRFFHVFFGHYEFVYEKMKVKKRAQWLIFRPLHAPFLIFRQVQNSPLHHDETQIFNVLEVTVLSVNSTFGYGN